MYVYSLQAPGGECHFASLIYCTTTIIITWYPVLLCTAVSLGHPLAAQL